MATSKLTVAFLAVLFLAQGIDGQKALAQNTSRPGAEPPGDSASDVEVRTQTQSAGSPPRQQVRGDNVRATTPRGVTPVEPLPRDAVGRRPGVAPGASGINSEPDVFLDVPELSVEEITLEVSNLQAHLALDARVANLVKLTAGVDASIDNVKLSIKGVKAKAQLRVHLDNVAYILDRTLTTIDRNPQLVERLLQSVDNTVGTVGNVANTALQPNGLLSQTVNTLGQTVQRTLDTTGNIVEKTLDTTGRVVSSRNVGNLLNLPVVRETTGATGQIVRQVRDTSGNLIEYSLDAAGKVVNPRLVSSATSAASATTGSVLNSTPQDQR